MRSGKRNLEFVRCSLDKREAIKFVSSIRTEAGAEAMIPVPACARGEPHAHPGTGLSGRFVPDSGMNLIEKH
jgi:hypothetical protein